MGWPVKSSSLAGGLFYFKVADRGDKTLRGASGPATKAFYPALSLCFSASSSGIPASEWPSWNSSWRGPQEGFCRFQVARVRRCYDGRIRRPASSSMSLTHAPCIMSACIVRPACRMRRVISSIVLTTLGWSGWPG
jgi:hypothetical protein